MKIKIPETLDTVNTHTRILLKIMDYIDLARKIAIILMIFGHVVHFEPVRRIIYSFHMPVFFIIVM